MGYPLEGQPVEFSPLGLWDALDGTHAPKGACSKLVNLIHDTTTPNTWVCRPAVNDLTSFADFSTPGVVSVCRAVGTRVYGMISTARNLGFDEPFCFETATGLFVTISGVAAGNVPLTQPTSGAWTPPSMDVIGSKIIVTHPGFSGVGTVIFGVVDISNPAAPAWSANNTATNPLTAVPTFVAAFNNRAWFVVNNAAVFSKSLDPLTVQNATDVLTIGDSGSPIVALIQQTITQTTGGIIQALVAFKASQGIWQITGDAAGGNLTLNGPTGGVGCPSARGACLTPAGIFYNSVDGIRIVKLDGTVSDKPIPGVRAPFGAVVTPSRVCSAYNDTVYRICGTWTIDGSPATNDYWYDFEINQFGGPHTFTYDCATPLGSVFVLASNAHPGKLFTSAASASSTDTYVEVGTQMTFTLASSVLPQRGDMSVQAVIESTIDVAFVSGQTGSYTVQMQDPAGVVLGQATVNAPAPAGGAVWNAFVWGAALWAALQTGFTAWNIDWSLPVVYKKGLLQISGNSFQGARIGSAWMRTESLGYMNLQVPP